MIIELEIGDRCYELEVTTFSAARHGGRWDPPEPGEIDLAEVVTVWEYHGSERNPTRHPDIRLEEFVRIYAAERGLPETGRVDWASKLLDECYGLALDRIEDDSADR